MTLFLWDIANFCFKMPINRIKRPKSNFFWNIIFPNMIFKLSRVVQIFFYSIWTLRFWPLVQKSCFKFFLRHPLGSKGSGQPFSLSNRNCTKIWGTSDQSRMHQSRNALGLAILATLCNVGLMLGLSHLKTYGLVFLRFDLEVS